MIYIMWLCLSNPTSSLYPEICSQFLSPPADVVDASLTIAEFISITQLITGANNTVRYNVLVGCKLRDRLGYWFGLKSGCKLFGCFLSGRFLEPVNHKG